MSYTCNNPECSAPENKKGKMYPSAMECPFCDVDLVEVVSFSEADTELISSLPYERQYTLNWAMKYKGRLLPRRRRNTRQQRLHAERYVQF